MSPTSFGRDSYRWWNLDLSFSTDSKAKNKVWVSCEGDRPVIAPHCKTSNRMLYAIFFDSKGPVFQIPVLKSSSFTGKFYRESVFTQLVDFYQKRRPRTGVRGIKLLHDNAPAHTGISERIWARYLRSSPIQPWPVPLWLLVVPKTKGNAGRAPFWKRCGIGSAVYQCLQHLPKEDYQAAFWKWVDRCEMCVEADGAYFERLR